MRSLPILTTPTFEYTRMKALTWASGHASVTPTVVQNTSAEWLATIVRQADHSKPLIINFGGITSIGDHVLSPVREALRKSQRSVLLINTRAVQTTVLSELDNPSVAYGGLDALIYGPADLQKDDVHKLIVDAMDHERDNVRTIVTRCFARWDSERRLSSTPLLATGVFDARRIISDPHRFLWISLLLEQQLEKALEAEESRALDGATDWALPGSLLSVSLRGSPFAAAIGQLSPRGFDVDVVDHMGPKQEIFEDHSSMGFSSGETYAYVGDFLIGGTEVKTAKMLARLMGSRITHAVVIGAWLPVEDYEASLGLKVFSLIDLKTCECGANYQF